MVKYENIKKLCLRFIELVCAIFLALNNDFAIIRGKVLQWSTSLWIRILGHWFCQAMFLVLQIMLVLYSLKTAYLHQNWRFLPPLIFTLFVLLCEVAQKESFIFIDWISRTIAKSKGVFSIPDAVEFIKQNLQIIHYHLKIVHRITLLFYFLILSLYYIIIWIIILYLS